MWRWGCLGAAALGAAALLPDFGMTWDEDVHLIHGDLLLAYFTSGFSDLRCLDHVNLRFYGPLFDLLSAAVRSLLGTPRVETQHFLIALFGLATLLGTYELGRQSGRRWVPLLAPALLLGMPRFFGHSFTNPKDLPFACLYVWSLVAIVAVARSQDRRLRSVLACAATLGAAFAIRPGAFPLLTAILLGTLGHSFLFSSGTQARADYGRLRRDLGATLTILPLAWIGMIALWPWAHQSPLANPLAAIREAAAFSYDYPVLFNGTVQPSSQLAWFYIPTYIAITTPLLTLAAALVGFALTAASALRLRTAQANSAEVAATLALALPLLAAVVLHPNVYDGLRHFLFLLPVLAFLAAVACDRFLQKVGHQGTGNGLVRALVTLTVSLTVLLPAGSLWTLHPYQTTYFNALVGGVGGAEGRFETDYWVSSYKEAVEWVNAKAELSDRPIRLVVAANSFNAACAQYYASRKVQIETLWAPPPVSRLPAPYDYFLATTRYGKADYLADTPVVHRIQRQGATFTVIRSNLPTTP